MYLTDIRVSVRTEEIPPSTRIRPSLIERAFQFKYLFSYIIYIEGKLCHLKKI